MIRVLVLAWSFLILIFTVLWLILPDAALDPLAGFSPELVSEAEGYGFIDAGFILGFMSAIPATLSLVARYRAAGFVERQQIKWLLAATGVFALAYIAAAVSDDDSFWWVMAVAVTAIPLAILCDHAIPPLRDRSDRLEDSVVRLDGRLPGSRVRCGDGFRSGLIAGSTVPAMTPSG